MLTANIPGKTLPSGVHPTIPSALDWNSAQSLRPTFEGWGPRI